MNKQNIFLKVYNFLQFLSVEEAKPSALLWVSQNPTSSSNELIMIVW